MKSSLKTRHIQAKGAARKQRTRQLVQIGGLVLKSGLLECLNIQTGEDLQEYENLPKAAQLLGFLLETLEETEITDEHLHQWQRRGERAIRYG